MARCCSVWVKMCFSLVSSSSRVMVLWVITSFKYSKKIFSYFRTKSVSFDCLSAGMSRNVLFGYCFVISYVLWYCFVISHVLLIC